MTVRPIEELKQIESLLAAKKSHAKSSREHIASSLQAVRNELARRGSTQDTVTASAQLATSDGREFFAA